MTLLQAQFPTQFIDLIDVRFVETVRFSRLECSRWEFQQPFRKRYQPFKGAGTHIELFCKLGVYDRMHLEARIRAYEVCEANRPGTVLWQQT